jgi:hypothetical protein
MRLVRSTYSHSVSGSVLTFVRKDGELATCVRYPKSIQFATRFVIIKTSDTDQIPETE